MTAQLYGQLLVSSQINYTDMYLADYLNGLVHNNIRCFLKTQRFTPRQLWQQVRPQVVRGTTSCSTIWYSTSPTADALS